jgi:outer membrane protein assembly factor BamB
MYRAPPPESPLVIAAVSAVVTAFHRTTGQVAWKVTLSPTMQTWMSRCIVAGDRVYVVHFMQGVAQGMFETGVQASALTALDYHSGAMLFCVRLSTNMWSPTLLLDGGQLFVADGRYLFAVDVVNGQGQWVKEIPEVGPNNVPIALALPGAAAQGDAR